MSYRHIKYFVIFFLALFFFGGRPVEFGEESTFFHGFIIPKPVISIGLATDLDDILIKASSGMKVYEVASGYRLLAEDADEVRVRGSREKLSEKYTILIAQTLDKKEAELLAGDLRKKAAARFIVEEVKESDLGGVFQVKAGDFLTRGEALTFMQQLRSLGMRDTWVVRENIPEEDAQPRWILIENELLPLDEEASLYFIPANPQSYLSANGKSYRGLFVLKRTPRGIALVNILNLEDYLKGVVPGELSPQQFNELQALKAQAVAARTYALKNIGQYKELGYDLVDTPRSQLYGGMRAEHPLSTKAVEETAGEVAVYKGSLINALYTSTCGGQTEDVDNVFGGRPVPYLQSAECTYEKRPEWEVAGGRQLPPIFLPGGIDAGPEIALAAALDILKAGSGVALFEAIPYEEALEGIRRAVSILGKPDKPLGADPAPPTFRLLARWLVWAFEWEDRVEHLLLPSEVDFILRGFPPVARADRNAFAYCVQAGIFPSEAGAAGPERLLTRAEFGRSLARAVSRSKELFQEGIFRSSGTDSIEVGKDLERIQLKPASQMFLIRNMEGDRSFASRLSLAGGERVRWMEINGEIGLIEVFFPPNTNILDRTSRFFRWQVRKSRAELEASINPYVPAGSLIDIEARRRGKSGRVSELQVTGSGGRYSLSGLKVRYALGLRDTLFAIDREFDAEGRITHFTFSGKGWGHGVGLCQVGAFGMALSGASYRDILKKYYRGAQIDKAY